MVKAINFLMWIFFSLIPKNDVTVSNLLNITTAGPIIGPMVHRNRKMAYLNKNSYHESNKLFFFILKINKIDFINVVWKKLH